MTNLWEVDHPYYAAEGNFYKNGLHSVFSSWGEFTREAFYGGDRDLNLVYRWDWHKPGFHEWDGSEALHVFFILPRKAICCSVEISVTEEDQDAVRSWLTECAQTVGAIWAPLTIPSE